MCALNFRCNVPMQDRVRADVSDGVSWYCPQCYTRKSIREGSFFSKSKITLQKWMIILHFWVHQYPVTDVMLEADVDKHTAIDAYQWFREICSSSLLLGPQIVLGGPGVVVHIDESLFRHKPKVYYALVYFMQVHYNIVYCPLYTRTTEAVVQHTKFGFLGWLTPQHPLLWAIWR